MSFSDNIGYLLQHTAATTARQSEQILQDRLGIGLSQFKIMMVLQWNPSVRQRRIAEQLGQTEASISRQVKLMHEDGLLQSTIRPENRREHITTLTSRGERIASQASAVLNQYLSPVFAILDEKQQQQLAELLDRLHKEVCKGDKTGRCYAD